MPVQLRSAPRLRPYQRDAIQSAQTALANDRNHVQVVSLPTAGGKTRVGLEVAFDFIKQHPDALVLWLAPRWELIHQARGALRKFGLQFKGHAVRIGGRHPQNPIESQRASIVFTTLHTWFSRHRRGALGRLGSQRPLLVIIDECHYGVCAQLGRALLGEYLGRVPMLGLSATPKLVPGKYRVAFAKSFTDLCPRYLARPQVREVATGAVWDPIIQRGEICSRSLAELGTMQQRNERIVTEYLDGRAAERYRRTLIYACNVRHADQIHDMLARQGVASQAVHSRMTDTQNDNAVDSFRRGTLEVLVTVGKLTDGLDVPEIDSIFLARPTASPTLLTQMIGRGARKFRGKKFFWVVEFTDSVKNLGAKLFHAHDYVVPQARRACSSRYGGARQHYESPDSPRFVALDLPGLEGITVVPDQTFGVELELGFDGSAAERKRLAKLIMAAIGDAARLPAHPQLLGYHENEDYTKWRLCRDGSCGLEIVSPILVGLPGFAELMRVSEAVNRLVEHTRGLRINWRTGLHITLATRLDTQHQRQGFAARVTRLEPGLYTLVAPSRLYGWAGAWQYNRSRRNRYCQPLREGRDSSGLPFSSVADIQDRFHSVNLTRADDPARLLEIRMHQGTIETRKIIPWIALWMHIFNVSRYRWDGSPRWGPVLLGGNTAIGRVQAEREDIFCLLRQEGIHLPPALEQRLFERRRELREAWLCATPKRVAGWEAAGWYDDTTRERNAWG